MKEIHPDVLEAIDLIDASLFSGCTFDEKENRDTLREMVERWSRIILAKDKYDEEMEKEKLLERQPRKEEIRIVIDRPKILDKMPKDNLCPECGKHSVITCRCFRRDSQCEYGHQWHTCTEHNKLVKGHSDHSIHGCTCGTGFRPERKVN